MPTIMGSHCVVIVNLKTPGHFYKTKGIWTLLSFWHSCHMATTGLWAFWAHFYIKCSPVGTYFDALGSVLTFTSFFSRSRFSQQPISPLTPYDLSFQPMFHIVWDHKGRPLRAVYWLFWLCTGAGPGCHLPGVLSKQNATMWETAQGQELLRNTPPCVGVCCRTCFLWLNSLWCQEMWYIPQKLTS